MPIAFWGENQNPATAEIMADARDRIEKREPLSPVQRIVLGEWTIKAKQRLRELSVAAQHDFLKDEEYAEMQALKEELEKIAPHVEKEEK